MLTIYVHAFPETYFPQIFLSLGQCSCFCFYPLNSDPVSPWENPELSSAVCLVGIGGSVFSVDDYAGLVLAL